MAKGLDIKRRIKSIKSTLKITKAMELISSVKMRKASRNALKSRDFVKSSWSSIAKIARQKQNEEFPLFTLGEKGKILMLVITSDKGLAGSYNSGILKKLLNFIEQNEGEKIDYITVGQKGRKFIQKIGGNIIADFPTAGKVNFAQISPVVKIAWDGFYGREYKKFLILYSEFYSIAKQESLIKQIIPLDPQEIIKEAPENGVEKYPTVFFEPDRVEVLTQIIRFTVRAQTYQAILEAEASEHAARMIAMKNASDAAGDLVDDLQFTFNQLRQNSITSELSEISAGRAAIE